MQAAVVAPVDAAVACHPDRSGNPLVLPVHEGRLEIRRQIDAVQVLMDDVALIQLDPIRGGCRVERAGEGLALLRTVEQNVAVAWLGCRDEDVAAELLAKGRQRHRLPVRLIGGEELRVVPAKELMRLSVLRIGIGVGEGEDF